MPVTDQQVLAAAYLHGAVPGRSVKSAESRVVSDGEAAYRRSGGRKAYFNGAGGCKPVIPPRAI